MWSSYESLPDTEVILPEDFTPGVNHVIIGRGKRSYNHSGNLKFRENVQSRLEEYSIAKSKTVKSSILLDIVRSVHSSGGFIKLEPSTGRWMTTGTFLAREKTSQTFRDILSEGYKSSKAAKKKRRQEKVTIPNQIENLPSFFVKQKQQQYLQHCEQQEPADDIGVDDNMRMDDEDLSIEDIIFFSSNETLERSPKDADNELFSSLSSIVSPYVDQNDMNPFEPTPMAEDSCDEDDHDAIMTSAGDDDTEEDISRKIFDSSDFTFMYEIKQEKSLPIFTPAESLDFTPTRNISIARSA